MSRRRRGRVPCVLACLFAAGVLHLEAYSQAAARGPGSAAEAAYREGQAALNSNRLPDAEAAFRRVIALTPRGEQGHAGLGVVLLKEDKTAEAAHELEIAHGIDKSDQNAALNLALVYQRLHQPAKALPLYASVVAGARLRKQPLPALVWDGYGRALAATGNLTQAATELKEALKSQPGDATLLGDLGSVYAQGKDWPRAEVEFAAAARLNPQAAIAHLRLGLAMQAQAKPGALQEVAEAARLAPEDAAIQLEWGRALASSGDDGRAIPVLEHVLALQPDFPEAAAQLAQAYQRSDRVPEAIALFQKLAAAEPENGTVLTNLGMAYTQMQRAKDAVPLLQRAVALDGQNVTAHQDLAAAYIQLSQFADAATELRAAIRLAPTSPQLHYNLGLALKGEDDAAGAIPELEQAEKLDANAPEPPYLLGVLYLQAGRYEDAARELQISLRLRPENGDGWATLGSVYNNLNRLPQAVEALQQAIKQLPSQPDPHLTLAAVLAKQNLTAEAAAERKQAATLMRANMNRQRAEVATNSGRSLLKSGDPNAAVEQFQEALRFDPEYAEAHLALADAYDAQGRKAEAASERAKAAAAPVVPGTPARMP